MVHNILKYLMVIGVVLLGFQYNAFADEEDKDKKTDQTKVTKTDTIKIKVNLDIQADDTLVFDDYDEDDDDDKGDNSSIASFNPTKHTSYTSPSSYDQMPEQFVDGTQDDEDRKTAEFDSIVPEQVASLKIKVYPNPASAIDQNIFVEHNVDDIAQITIYSISGQVAFTSQTRDKKVKILGLVSGLYIVNVSGDNSSESKKLLVQ